MSPTEGWNTGLILVDARNNATVDDDEEFVRSEILDSFAQKSV